jgi:predicted DCC family thiol-disulfide oxidoreductase YuxK
MERLYFDGECGFCRERVRWIVRREPPGGLFRYAPLGGPTFEARIPPERRATLGHTLVVETEDGRLLARSDAVVHVLRRLGRRRTAALLALVPRFLRDLGYRVVARSRSRGACAAPDPVPQERSDP